MQKKPTSKNKKLCNFTLGKIGGAFCWLKLNMSNGFVLERKRKNMCRFEAFLLLDIFRNIDKFMIVYI